MHKLNIKEQFSISDKKMDVVRALKQAANKPVSGSELGRKLGVSRTMIWKYIKEIEERGYIIKSIQGSGYVLKAVPDKLYPSELKDGLETGIIGKHMYYFDSVDSTNNIAKRLGFACEEGAVILAEKQYHGRGRRDQHWYSPRGGVWLSVILKPQMIMPADISLFTLMAGVAVAKTIRKYNIFATIKWPNDILVNEKKVCGILTEMDAEAENINYIVIGIGINVNIPEKQFSDEFKLTSASLHAFTETSIDRIAFVQTLLKSLEEEYISFKNHGFAKILEDWTSLSSTIGKDIEIRSFQNVVSGKAIGINENGALLVKSSSGLKTIVSGSCIHKQQV